MKANGEKWTRRLVNGHNVRGTCEDVRTDLLRHYGTSLVPYSRRYTARRPNADV